MFLEKFFSTVGTRINSDIAEKIILDIKPEIKDTKPLEEMNPKEIKSREKKLENKRKEVIEIFQSGIKDFARKIKSLDFHRALLELIEIAYMAPDINFVGDFHALMTLCWVALGKHGPAEREESNARKGNPKWAVFDEITDDVYECGKFFIADFMNTTVKKLDTELLLDGDLHWDTHNFNKIVEELGTILSLENEKIWSTLKKDGAKLSRYDETTEIENLIWDFCDRIILPFYARLELSKIAGNIKTDD